MTLADWPSLLGAGFLLALGSALQSGLGFGFALLALVGRSGVVDFLFRHFG